MNELWKQLRVPKEFELGDHAIWQDVYIAKNLLKAHLNPYTDGASRNFAFMEKSLEFIHQTASHYHCHDMLDLGCGPGLYSEQLAARDYAVTGIDFSENSIRYAKAHAKEHRTPVLYRYENYLELRDSNRYDMALLIYCEFGAFSPENRKKILANVWQSLKKGGKFLLDVFSVEKYIQFEEGKSWETYEGPGFWAEDDHVVLHRERAYPNRVTLEQATVMTKEDIKTYHIWHQYFTLEQITQEMTEAGFTVINVYDNLAGESGNEQSETIALLLEKATK